MRFYFVYRGRSTPSGGHKQIRLFVSLLNELGEEAYLLMDGSSDDNSLYNVSVPMAPFDFESADKHIYEDDIVVHPESNLEKFFNITRNWKCRKAVNNQNGYYALAYRPNSGYEGKGVEFVMAIAPYSVALTSQFLGIPLNRVFHVPPWILRNPFDGNFDEIDARLSTIAFMPRKLPHHIEKIQAMVQQEYPHWEWVKIDGSGEAEVARLLGSCRIFLATQDREGCPLPAVEAMCSGCLVVGYPGTGFFPHPYATQKNGLWVDDRRVPEAAAALIKAIQLVEARAPEYFAYLQEARSTAERFSRKHVLAALRDMVQVVRDRSYATRKLSTVSLSVRAQMHARAHILTSTWKKYGAATWHWFGQRRARVLTCLSLRTSKTVHR